MTCIQQCLQSGSSPNVVDELGFTPLMLLASQGLGECLQLILEAPGCIVNKRTDSMQMALHFAAEKGHYDCARRLIASRAMVNVSNDWGETPLIKAVIGGCLDTVNLLLQCGAKTDMTDLQGCNALMHACRSGVVRIVEKLIEYGACVNHSTKTLPLHQAVIYGHVDTITLLLKSGAKASIRDLHGWLPIEIATQTDQSSAIECLIRQNAVSSSEDIDAAVTSAAKYNAIKSLDVLLRNGGDADSTDYQGFPALFIAIYRNNCEIVRLLIQFNCNVNRNLSRVYLPNSELHDLFSSFQTDPVTPLMVALSRASPQIIRMLTIAGAKTGVARRMFLNQPLKCFPILASDDDDGTMNWLMNYMSTPSSLSHLSRLIIRKTLKRNVSNIYQLPIPHALMDYLSFKDIDSIL